MFLDCASYWESEKPKQLTPDWLPEMLVSKALYFHRLDSAEGLTGLSARLPLLRGWRTVTTTLVKAHYISLILQLSCGRSI